VVVSLVLCRYFLTHRKRKTSDISVEGSGQYLPSRTASYMQVSSVSQVSEYYFASSRLRQTMHKGRLIVTHVRQINVIQMTNMWRHSITWDVTHPCA
jgi:precorrin-6B methylase 1